MNLLGNLEAGKLADIVLLDANPPDNIANTLTIWRAVAGGKIFAEPRLTPTDEDEEFVGSEPPDSTSPSAPSRGQCLG
jgi:hypothetical protein